MPVGLLIDLPGLTAEAYDAVNAKMNFFDDPPEGLHLHVGGEAGNGNWRIFEVWESQQACEAFDQARLLPALAAVLGDEAAQNPPPMEFFELHGFLKP
jgi:hypothetical protein